MSYMFRVCKIGDKERKINSRKGRGRGKKNGERRTREKIKLIVCVCHIQRSAGEIWLRRSSNTFRVRNTNANIVSSEGLPPWSLVLVTLSRRFRHVHRKYACHSEFLGSRPRKSSSRITITRASRVSVIYTVVTPRFSFPASFDLSFASARAYRIRAEAASSPKQKRATFCGCSIVC